MPDISYLTYRIKHQELTLTPRCAAFFESWRLRIEALFKKQRY